MILYAVGAAHPQQEKKEMKKNMEFETMNIRRVLGEMNIFFVVWKWNYINVRARIQNNTRVYNCIEKKWKKYTAAEIIQVITWMWDCTEHRERDDYRCRWVRMRASNFKCTFPFIHQTQGIWLVRFSSIIIIFSFFSPEPNNRVCFLQMHLHITTPTPHYKRCRFYIFFFALSSLIFFLLLLIY